MPNSETVKDVKKDFVKGELRAAPGHVIVLPVAPTTQVGDIVLPTQAQEEVFEGRVVHHQPSPRKNPNLEESYKFDPNEFVIWGMYAGRPYIWPNEKGEKVEYKILHETEIIAWVEEAKK